MNVSRLLFKLALGRRLPVTAGDLRIRGIGHPIQITRDHWGIPSIRAGDDAGAWFGLGFCHGQDRTFQLEGMLRVARGTLAELVGAGALPIDRLSRRIGFYRAAKLQLPVISVDVAARIDAYAHGINAGASVGLRRRPHEFVLLRSHPTPWTAGDVLAVLKLQSFALASGWDSELARMRILTADGPDALEALEPTYPEWLPSTADPATAAGPALERLAADLELFAAQAPTGAASNTWALDPTRTASGRPIFANDPHLAPSLPPHWYLCRIETAEWAAAGGSFVGGPAITAGHNGFCAWGLTAGCADNADLFIEEVGPDNASVRQGSTFVACPVQRETIRVRGAPSVIEEVIETPRGPIISPALEGEKLAISLRAVWLDPLPVEGLVGIERAKSFEEFRECFRHWPGPSLNMGYADETGRIGWQLVGQAPTRRKGYGSLPLSGSDPDAGWEKDLVAFESMPFRDGSAGGFLVSANGRPVPAGDVFLGEDWLDGYRTARIGQALMARRDWDVSSTQRLQLDTVSLPWQETRDAVLGGVVTEAGARVALEVLRDWDGSIGADSAAAAVFEVFVAEMARRTVSAKAPRSADFALARGFTPLQPQTMFGARRVSHLVRLLRVQPEGWFPQGWSREIDSALAAAVERLTRDHGAQPSQWRWGKIRPLTLRHPMSIRRPMDRIYNLGPFPYGGDTNTIAQAGVDLFDPISNPGAVPALRMVIDTGDWDRSRFSLPGGQSGNPISPHYADLLPLWRAGKGVPIPWSAASVRRAARETLTLQPT